MISPFRPDVVVTGFVLAVPVLLLALRGDFTADDVVTRLPWCLAAGWAVVALVRWASTPPPPVKPSRTDTHPTAAPTDGEPASTA
ncbi:hypothetical protein GCU67_12015 [Modestobacter muralis]|uniref:Uncharacterized protein n=1 Tax=Modestobacter muralis TaxID=1608614 RepID=A0A6P0EVF6_9ACTN|nr:hypothetical protein [Modestobacter muralis]NEK94890.1 hypothetical protein [Modestobacter muralis]NEN51778.1 hypothetical protein [Modestobacter muralis]